MYTKKTDSQKNSLNFDDNILEIYLMHNKPFTFVTNEAILQSSTAKNLFLGNKSEMP